MKKTNSFAFLLLTPGFFGGNGEFPGLPFPVLMRYSEEIQFRLNFICLKTFFLLIAAKIAISRTSLRALAFKFKSETVEMKTKSARSIRFNSRLAAYSATATAALLAAPAADATIQNITTFSYDGGATFVTTPPDIVGNNTIGNNIVDFSAGPFRGGIVNTYFPSRGAGRASIVGDIAVALPIISVKSTAPSYFGYSRFAGRLSYYPMFIAGRLFRSQPEALAVNGNPSTFGPYYPHGLFLPPANGATTGYIGFKANANSHTYYGWLRVKVSGNGVQAPTEVSLVDRNGDRIYGAFGLKSDNITAGEVAPVPEPSVAAIGGLGLLALGAAGLRELRRRRQQKAAN